MVIACAVTLGSMHAVAAQAICMPLPDTNMAELAQLAGRDPHAALTELAKRQAAAKEAGAPAETIAWLHAIEADAYWQLSDSPGGEKAARAGLNQNIDHSSDVYVQLLIQYVFRDFRTETFRASVPVLQAARRNHVPGSPADICLQATLGDAQRLAGDLPAAAPNLIAAYRHSQLAGQERQRIYAAYALALFMRSSGDYSRALQLHAERTKWDEEMGHRFKLAGDYFITGRFLRLSGKNREALPWLDKAVSHGTAVRDTVGVIHYQMEQCAALTGLGQTERALPLCQRAETEFRRIDPDAVGQVQLYLANIALQQGDPRRSLALLDAALSSSSVKSSNFTIGEAYRLKSEASAALGDTASAYRALREYVRLRGQQFDNDRSMQIIAREAETTTQTQLARNLRLQQQLQASQIRAREERFTTTAIITGAIFLIILLLAMTLIARRNRKFLERAANVDSLTGLLNRRKTVQLTEAALATALNDGSALSVAILDIDHFKQINDTHGHPAGDAVLLAFAAVLRANTRDTDVIGRWGGEEFLLVMPHSTADVATSIIDRIRDSAARIDIPAVSPAGVSFSAGITASRMTGSEGQGTMEALITQADTALYVAKREGRSMTKRWDDDMAALADARPSTRALHG